MFKKILIPSFAFFGMSLIALYAARVENISAQTEVEIENDNNKSVVVLELFTSQGCSSCPPADALLDQVKKEFPQQVVALSYHVDYWNYIGWTDPFSKSVYTKKQRDYNRKFRYPSNYTPELVVNGQEHFVGSNRSKLYAKVKSYAARESDNKVELTNLKRVGDEVHFNYAVLGDIKNKDIRLVLVLDEKTTSVKRGENRNRTLKNSNIVVNEIYLPLLEGNGSASIGIPNIVGTNDALTVMGIVQTENLEITGAAQRALP